MTDEPRVCIDRYLTPAQSKMVMRAVRPPSLAALNEKVWPNGKSLTVGFLGGEAVVREKVWQYANEWRKYANIGLVLTNPDIAEIRIAFDRGGSWSYIGTDALTIPRDQATMNFGWLTLQTVDAEYSRVVLHELGHALGCLHEHQHPEAGIPWDVEAVYRYYSGPPNNWSREDIEANLFRKYGREQTRFSAFDPTSIMSYPVPNALTLGDYEIGWNIGLSATDKQYIGILYPMAPEPPPTTKFPPPPWGTPERAIWNDGYNACYCEKVDPDNAGCK